MVVSNVCFLKPAAMLPEVNVLLKASIFSTQYSFFAQTIILRCWSCTCCSIVSHAKKLPVAFVFSSVYMQRNTDILGSIHAKIVLSHKLSPSVAADQPSVLEWASLSRDLRDKNLENDDPHQPTFHTVGDELVAMDTQ